MRKQYARDVVLLYSVYVKVVLDALSHLKPHPNFGLREEEFDLSFGNQMRVRRVTEYCQWKEV